MNRKVLSILLALLVFGFLGAGSAIAKKNLNKTSGENASNAQSEYTAGVQGATAGISGNSEATKQIKEESDKEKANSIYAGAIEEEEEEVISSKIKPYVEDKNDFEDENDAIDGESVPRPEEKTEKK